MTIKVLIVDDSSFFRKRLANIISQDPRLEVIGTANNGQEAIEQNRSLKPDVITMDLEMPVMDGITAVKRIMSDRKAPVLMVSSWTTKGAKSTLDALEAGAADFLPKRFDDLSSDEKEAQRKLCQRIYQIAKDFSSTPHIYTKPSQVTEQAVHRSSSTSKFGLVAIGTSTGGPVALQQVLTPLPANFPHPILLIQHMPGTFTPSFAERLDRLCKIRVKQAEDGDILQPGTAYLAPGGQQMYLKGSFPDNLRVAVHDDTQNSMYKPCVDFTLDSVAKVCGNKTLAIILTGMGSDGKNGCQQIKQAGGSVWAQDENSSTIYGMPMAVAKAGLADKVLNLFEIGNSLAQCRA